MYGDISVKLKTNGFKIVDSENQIDVYATSFSFLGNTRLR